jgi:hypothetical protein
MTDKYPELPHMRKSTIFFASVALGLFIFALLMLHASRAPLQSEKMLTANASLVKTLILTDLSLFTEARYTRHPSMADLHSPFQDHPMALDHFPSGSLVTPPRFRKEAP